MNDENEDIDEQENEGSILGDDTLHFYEDLHIQIALTSILGMKPIDLGENRGKFYHKKLRRNVEVGWIFSPEDFNLVHDVDLLVVFAEPTEDCIPINGYMFLPSPDTIANGDGWMNRLYRLYTMGAKSRDKVEFVCIRPKALEDAMEGV